MVSPPPARAITLRDPLTVANALRFPLQSRASRRDLLVGAAWLLVPGVGWLLNMGHRVRLVHRMHRGEPPWPAWERPGELLRHGVITFLGMAYYGAPGALLVALGAWRGMLGSIVAGGLLLALAVVAIPGYMSHYCRAYDPREIFDPFRALRRVGQGGAAYWKAWGIVCVAITLSFVGLLGLGVGFLVTSVWFWQTAAFGFASVFTQRFDLDDDAPPG